MVNINKSISEQSQFFGIAMSFVFLISFISLFVKKVCARRYGGDRYYNMENVNIVCNACTIMLLSTTMTLMILFISGIIFTVGLEKLNN